MGTGVAARREKGGAQESLCNRSFLLFPGVAAAEGELSLGEVNLDSRWMGGVDGTTRTGREGSAGAGE